MTDYNTVRNPSDAFDDAIEAGRLSAYETSPIYAGNYMYMGTNTAGIDTFKNIETRQYLP